MRISQSITRNAQVAAGGVATVFADRQRTWADHVERVSRLAGGLRSLGVGDGSRVAALGLNSDRYLEWFYAVPWAGAVVVPINIRLAPPEMVHWIEDSGATVLFVDDAFLAVVPTLLEQTGIAHVVYLGDGPTPDGMLGFEELATTATPIEPADAGGDELAGLFYTGGTTGRSKGVMLSHDNLMTNAFHTMPALGFRADTRYLHAAPMFHLANGAGMYATSLAGGTHVIVPMFTPDAVLDAIETHRVTSTVLVPTMIAALTQVPDVSDRDLSSWEQLMYGGSPISEAVLEAVTKLVPTLQLQQAYGQTEAAPVLTMLPFERHTFSGPLAGKTRSAGQAVPGVEVTILDEEDRPVERGVVGQICARGDNVMLGYLNRPEETAAALANGWLHTGDGGYMDEDGFVFVVDRIKDMIISGGENVYSAEVENALAAHPAVVECAVFGIPHERWGEQVHAVVRTAAGTEVTSQELIDHCHELIAGFKCPRSVDVVAEELPKSGAGKILKRDLRAPWWEGETRSVH